MHLTISKSFGKQICLGVFRVCFSLHSLSSKYMCKLQYVKQYNCIYNVFNTTIIQTIRLYEFTIHLTILENFRKPTVIGLFCV